MTPDDVRKRVDEIRDTGHGPQAHMEEDTLFLDVLRAIADGTCADPRACAAEAVKSAALEFDRWYE